MPAADITVSVYNGTEVNGWSDDIAQELVNDGFNSATAGYPDSASPATTTLTYGPGEAAQAQTTAKALGLPATALKQGTAAGLKLVLGADWTTGKSFPNSKPVAPPVNTAVALASTYAQNGSADNQCVQVSKEYTQPGATPRWSSPTTPTSPTRPPDTSPRHVLRAGDPANARRAHTVGRTSCAHNCPGGGVSRRSPIPAPRPVVPPRDHRAENDEADPIARRDRTQAEGWAGESEGIDLTRPSCG
ncbi:LytR C-terminal domain-containing protein [Streptacidiphilus sp. 4-A2]|nr:LytR C-terminal domain-containing protein [Streptacidiphilus sp. 4-A2]